MTASRLVRTHFARAAALAALLALITPVAAEATTYTAARKFGRGLAAMTTCFLEVPGNIVKTTRARSAAWGWTLGLAEGMGRLVVRVPVGVWETFTAPFELPPGFKPIIEPEFPWGYFDQK